MNRELIAKQVCQSMCDQVQLHQRPDGRLMVETPFTFADGDAFSVFLEELPSGGLRLTDCGLTLMHLSYEMDVDRIHEGTRGKIWNQILDEMGIQERGGALFIECATNEVGANLFRFGQGLTRVHDLNFLKRVRVESTFYEDLQASLEQVLGLGTLIADYQVPEIEQPEKYLVDFCFQRNQDSPLFIFGVPNNDKARLATVILEHLARKHIAFASLVVFQDQSTVSSSDAARLNAVADSLVSSLSGKDEFRRKVRRAAGIPLVEPRS